MEEVSYFLSLSLFQCYGVLIGGYSRGTTAWTKEREYLSLRGSGTTTKLIRPLHVQKSQSWWSGNKSCLWPLRDKVKRRWKSTLDATMFSFL